MVNIEKLTTNFKNIETANLILLLGMGSKLSLTINIKKKNSSNNAMKPKEPCCVATECSI